jgi:hypothetical protein
MSAKIPDRPQQLIVINIGDQPRNRASATTLAW